MSLIEDRLCLRIKRRDLVFGVVLEPEQLMALEAGEVFGFRDEGREWFQWMLSFKLREEGVLFLLILG